MLHNYSSKTTKYTSVADNARLAEREKMDYETPKNGLRGEFRSRFWLWLTTLAAKFFDHGERLKFR